jgi:hypothetical protein
VDQRQIGDVIVAKDEHRLATILSGMPETSAPGMRSRPGDSGVHTAELMAALSIATDLGMGQPLESALCSCVVAVRLGAALHLDGDTLRDVYYHGVRDSVCCYLVSTRPRGAGRAPLGAGPVLAGGREDARRRSATVPVAGALPER